MASECEMTQCPCGISRDDCTYHKPDPTADGGGVGFTTSGGRGSGRTTRQLQALPKGGWYFCSNLMDTVFIRGLAKKIGRTDIIMKRVTELRDYYQFHGSQISGFDVDHYCFEHGIGFEPEIALGILQLKSCVRP